MSAVPDDLAARLEDAVRAVPGVSALYSAAPLVARAVGELPLTGTRRPDLVHVESTRDGLRITASIGVAPDAAAPDVAASAAVALHAVAGLTARVVVRVSRVAN